MTRFFRWGAMLAGGACLALGNAPGVTPAEVAEESRKANAFFERSFDAHLKRHPEEATMLGYRQDRDKWDDVTDPARAAELSERLAELSELKRSIRFERLDAQTQLSYRLWVYEVETEAEAFRWRFHDYPVNPMFGEHTGIPAFLINQHTVSSEADAVAYVARLRGLPTRLKGVIDGLEERRSRGIVPPRFVFPLVIDSCKTILSGAPFEPGETKNALLEDIERKITALKDISEVRKAELTAQARQALIDAVKPAYEALIAQLESLEQVATEDDGAWKWPSGDAFYRYIVRRMTTTGMSTEEVHDLGLREVARIHKEMDAIRQRVGFQGDRAAFFLFMRDDPQFYFPNTAEGKSSFLRESTHLIEAMRVRLDDLFITKPTVPIVVKAVEPFRERESGGAFYEPPALDGSRPGRFYVNLYDMNAVPKYEMDALAYHEGIPGHHMQIAIAQELTALPRFRQVSEGYTAYVEGWALYCERVPKEMGFYQDPYSDFGRLSMELWRAARLVVDTGIHAKRWTRKQTIAWLAENTPSALREIETSVNRYIVWPGQATAYTVGMLRIQQMRARAEKDLGSDFDLRTFHDVLLRNGALPLDLLDEQVSAWIAERKSARP